MIKRYSAIIFLLGLALVMNAQIDCKQEIQESFAIYRHEIKQKNYDEALNSWRKVFRFCPDFNQYIYTDGPKLYYNRIKQDEENKFFYLDTLMMIYDLRIQYFGNREKVLGKKGSDLLKYNPLEYEKAYEMLKISVDAQGNATLPNIIVSYFESLVMYSEFYENQGEAKRDILDAYVVLTDIIDYNITLAKSEIYVREYQKALKKIEERFEPYASCNELINVFRSRLQTDGDHLSSLKKIVSLLSKKDCKDNEVFYTAVRKLHDMEPTSSSAYNMGNMCMGNKNYSDAVDYYKQAIQIHEMESIAENAINLSVYYYQLSHALRMNHSYSSARTAAIKAADLKPGWGNPYIMIGDMYIASANSCGSSNLEKGSVYWVAVDMFMKAKSVDNLLTELANKRISRYSKYFPSKEDCFFENIQEGSSYKVGCWIGKSTRVRTRD